MTDRLNRHELPTLSQLERWVRSFYGDRKLIIQCAIDTMTIDGKQVDLRATLQRNGSGELEVVAIPVRVGQTGSPVTSTRTGSEVYRFDDFFMNVLPHTESRRLLLKYRICQFLVMSYLAVEETYGGFGELGIDFALDNQGRLWFIECNAKPGHDSVYRSYDFDTIEKVFRMPLEYAGHLSAFPMRSGD